MRLNFGEKIGFFICLLLLISACDHGNSRGPIGGAGGSGPVSQLDGGSTVGNGFVSYANEEWGLFFSHPQAWIVEEKNNSIHLKLPGAEGKKAASLEFTKRSKRLGTTEKDIRQWKRSLGKSWNETKIFGRDVIWTERFDGLGSKTFFYWLNEKREIVSATLSTFRKDLKGRNIVWAIMAGLLEDHEGPKVEKVFFEPTSAAPGETAKLVIIARDAGSGINVAAMGKESPVPGLHPLQASLGYNVPHYESDQGLAQAFPLYKGFRRGKQFRIEYTFTVPKNAPNGEIVPSLLNVYDRKGNVTRVVATRRAAGAFEISFGKRRKNVPMVYGSLVAGARELPLPSLQVDNLKAEDRLAPKVQSLWFSHVEPTVQKPYKKLYLKLHDDTEIRPYVAGRLERFSGVGERLPSCSQWNPKLYVEDVRLGLYSVRIDVSRCFQHRAEAPSGGKFVFDSLRAFDGVGNVRHCASSEAKLKYGSHCVLPKVSFELSE